MKLLPALILAIVAMPVVAESGPTAADLNTACQKIRGAVNSKGKWDGKRSEDVYLSGQCEGFIEGWIEGISGSVLPYNGKPVSVRVKTEQLKDNWTVADALNSHLKAHPLDSGKSADEVLRTILLANELSDLQPYIFDKESDTSLHNTVTPQ
jgi:hypothetical protein